ncbi:type II toxin-antitoxin system PemK/MazF family toxin [Gandjariella thermophila]|uniref:Uncharacterized protein n=1 Tax=Gandjariella thermophila TaxID=1931992 RepID=A0A4D4J414_9PSEU|nr:type II toxin-antitoxin system PemK/MazF family toxin [Gandjariella thermophila]GDY29840.1 hypothetical protein GTS_14730 [Gandjariella thermophila]
MGRSRRASENLALFILCGKLAAQWMAASFLSYPPVLLYLLTSDPVLLGQHDEVWVFSCCAPLAALWVVLRHRRVRLRLSWIVGRSLALLALSAVVAAMVPTPPGLRIVDLNPVRSGAVLWLLWVWIIVWRIIDRRVAARQGTQWVGTPWAGTVRQAERGDIWWAEVPFEKGSYEDGGQSSKDRPCLVVSTFNRHAYVLKITSVPKEERHGYIAIPAGWHPENDKPSWLQLHPLLKVPKGDFRRYVTSCPEWFWDKSVRFIRRMPRRPPTRSRPAPPRGLLSAEPTRPDRAGRDAEQAHSAEHGWRVGWWISPRGWSVTPCS